MQGIRQHIAAGVLAGLVAAACGSASTTPGSTAPGSTNDPGAGADDSGTTSASIAGSSATSDTARPTDRACADSTGATPLESGPTVSLERIHDQNGITIDAVIYPHPDYAGNPWSQWGQGIVASTGRFYSAIGDHLGADGNSFVYEYDPDTNELALVTDVLSVVDHNPGAWGYGKIHAQMALGPCDEVFFATYWGSRRGLSYTDGYAGDLLFHIDPYDRTLVDHGVTEGERGFPTMASAPAHGVLYTIAVDPITNAGTFLVIDAITTDVRFSISADAGFRSIGVDGDGAAYFSSKAGELSVYDPVSNSIIDTISAPGAFIRAADTFSDGTVVGVMQSPETFFVISGEALQPLSDAIGYTTSVGLSGDGSELFYLPGAHGNSTKFGAILRAIDTKTGGERDVVALGDIVTEGLGVTIGGTYNLVVDRAANRIYLGVNVDPSGSGGGFGEVALLVIGLP